MDTEGGGRNWLPPLLENNVLGERGTTKRLFTKVYPPPLCTAYVLPVAPLAVQGLGNQPWSLKPKAKPRPPGNLVDNLSQPASPVGAQANGKGADTRCPSYFK